MKDYSTMTTFEFLLSIAWKYVIVISGIKIFCFGFFLTVTCMTPFSFSWL